MQRNEGPRVHGNKSKERFAAHLQVVPGQVHGQAAANAGASGSWLQCAAKACTCGTAQSSCSGCCR